MHRVWRLVHPPFPFQLHQVTKIWRANPSFVSIQAYHLDEIKTTVARNRIVQELLGLDANTQESIFLFSLPQAITSDTANM
eukprot:scaffold190306_cov28-Attheya_sp.AAC.1